MRGQQAEARALPKCEATSAGLDRSAAAHAEMLRPPDAALYRDRRPTVRARPSAAWGGALTARQLAAGRCSPASGGWMFQVWRERTELAEAEKRRLTSTFSGVAVTGPSAV
jgi:hypothetical protein